MAEKIKKTGKKSGTVSGRETKKATAGKGKKTGAGKPAGQKAVKPAGNIKKASGSRAVKKPETVDLPVQTEEIDPDARDRGDIPMSLIGHLDEFRSRFVFSLISILVITLGSFFFSDQLLYIINKPYLSTGLKLNVFNLIDGFLLRLKASLIFGLLIGFPIIIYEVWKYIAPAIEKSERRYARVAVFAAVMLFYLGIALTYISLPMAIKALLGFTPPGMNNMINASDYLSLVMLFCLAMGVIFELPIVILILTRIGIVTPSFLIRKRKWAIVLIWVVAAMITPTVDPLTQSMVALPLMLLYEISIIISRIVVIRKKKRELRSAS